MHEVKVMSLDRIEVSNSEIRILTRDTFGDLALVFPQTLWESVLREVSFPSDPSPEELGELRELRQRLGEHARKNSFATVLDDAPLGGAPGKDSGQQFDLVLRPAGLLAVTTGYIILPVVSPEHVARL